MIDDSLYIKAQQVLTAAHVKCVRLATVESCTGGLIAATLTQIAGASEIVECGFVTYSNRAKNTLVDVPFSLIKEHGAVSKQVAVAMARGGLYHSDANLVVAVTGIAGPDGGTGEKPVGLVHLATARAFSSFDEARRSRCLRVPPEHIVTHHYEARFGALDRAEIRQATVAKAFDLLLQAMEYIA